MTIIEKKVGSYDLLRQILIFSLLGIVIFSVPQNVFSGQYLDLRQSLTPVKHQGQRNTCSVFAATALMEYLLKLETGRNVDLSESYNYWAAKKYSLTTDALRQKYKHRDGLAGFLAVDAYRHGSMLEWDWAYEEKNWFQLKDRRCQTVNNQFATECYTGTPPKGAKCLRYGISPIYIPRHEIGRFILKYKKPVIMNVLWCDGAIDSRTGRIRMPTSTEIEAARERNCGHVITLVGYEAKTEQLIFRNSYGPTWGTKGYGMIPEKYVVDHCEVCSHLSRLNSFSSQEKEFLRRASMGEL